MIRQITVADDGRFVLGFQKCASGFEFMHYNKRIPSRRATAPPSSRLTHIHAYYMDLLFLKHNHTRKKTCELNAGDKQRTWKPTNQNTRISFVETFPRHFVLTPARTNRKVSILWHTYLISSRISWSLLMVGGGSGDTNRICGMRKIEH